MEDSEPESGVTKSKSNPYFTNAFGLKQCWWVHLDARYKIVLKDKSIWKAYICYRTWSYHP